MKTEFETMEFEGENDTMFTFLGHNSNFCIMLNSKCVHSVKTINSHKRMIHKLCKERSMKQSNN